MRKYKTWEAIKMMTENPKLRFRYSCKLSLSQKVEVDIFVDNYRLINFNCAYLDPEFEWEMVREPIEFRKAVEAFNKGYRIRCVTGNDRVKIFNPKSHMEFLKESTGESVSVEEVLMGTWFIDDESMEI